ncbi:unnamed protein product [Closterium sp. Yama58-4]|nr:unnamed protein product [Closterium sp. Yama58-4]
MRLIVSTPAMALAARGALQQLVDHVEHGGDPEYINNFVTAMLISMSSDDDGDDGDTRPYDENDLARDEDRLKNPSTVLNPGGSFCCPFCPEPEYQRCSLDEIKAHAEEHTKAGCSSVDPEERVSDGMREGAKESRQHKLLLDRLMQPDLQPGEPVRTVTISTARPLLSPAVVEVLDEQKAIKVMLAGGNKRVKAGGNKQEQERGGKQEQKQGVKRVKAGGDKQELERGVKRVNSGGG